MSDSKFKYFSVTTTKVVRANNQADALKIASRAKGFTQVPGELLTETSGIERISAAEAKGQLTQSA